jgi:hypothetical protein
MMKGTVRTAILFLACAAVASAQTPAGGDFRINTYTIGRQDAGRPAMEPDGDFVVVWNSDGQDGNGYGVFGQRFAASGAPVGSEFQINTYTTGFQGRPAVAVGSRGDFVVVWESVSPDGSFENILGRRYDASGNAIGGEFLVNTFTPSNQYRARVGRASDGRFVVGWVSFYGDGSANGIAARRFGATGSPIGAEFVVNTYTTVVQNFVDVGVEANGNFVAVWQDYANRDGSGWGIFGQRYDASGNRLGSDFQVNSYTTSDQSKPSVSVSPAGGFVVVWHSFGQDGSGYGVVARRFDASGNAVGNDFVVNTFTTGSQGLAPGQVAHDARGNFVITWDSPDGYNYGAFAQRFSASGGRRGAEFRVNSYTTGPQNRPSIASDAVGNFVVAWDSIGQDGSGYGVFARRFGGLVPAALGVDGPPGNRHLEPGETVDVRPSWRNINGAAQTFTGTLTNITGPTGPTYTITDAAGSYGSSVPDGATAPCSDCYAISVSNPSTRPALHWDVSAVESIAPDAQGQQKQWAMHVGASFADVPTTSSFYHFVETLLHNGITGGCGGANYCPSSSTTREQMAVFVLVAKEGSGYLPPVCATPVFPDVPASSPFCRWVEELARRGVAGGCGNGNFCPSGEVTREQMAVFVLRTLEPALTPPACAPPNTYLDVPETSPFCRWIEELANRGVVSGCGSGNYCPAHPVTREQMGVFMGLTFGLTLYGA